MRVRLLSFLTFYRHAGTAKNAAGGRAAAFSTSTPQGPAARTKSLLARMGPVFDGHGSMTVSKHPESDDDFSHLEGSKDPVTFERTSELEAGVRSFHRSLDDAIPRYKAKVADPECDDVSTVVVEQLSDELRKRLGTERLTGCKIEYERDL